MNWLNKVADELVSRHPEGEIIVSSGVTPSGKYHIGTLREVLTAEAIRRELARRGRDARHIHVVDDFDVFRKIPADVPDEFEEHLGKPLFLIPAPDGSGRSYADYFLQDLEHAVSEMDLEMKIVRAHERYQDGAYAGHIEKTLDGIEQVTDILTEVSGRNLGDSWSPVQVREGEYLKTRKFAGLDKQSKTIQYVDANGQTRAADYAKGEVKLSWRIDWPARWQLLDVMAEPFGRDHATKGGSYDTGQEIAKRIFGYKAPLPVPYHFINRTGETKKLSKSSGNVITAAGLLDVMPPETIWYFMLRYAPKKQLFFDEGNELMNLFDDFSMLKSKPDKTENEKHLLELCLHGVEQPTVSGVPFSHLVASYQAALKDADRTLDIIKRTEYEQTAEKEADIIRRELKFINRWLDKYAPEEVKFTVQDNLPEAELSSKQSELLDGLAGAIESEGPGKDGQWFHDRIYEQKDRLDLSPAESFQAVYRVILGQDRGPQAGWFLAALDRDWLIRRLKREG